MFKKKSDHVVGLELDTGEARVVELCGNARAPSLAAWGRTPLPKGSMSEGMVNDPDAVAKALKELWAKSRVSSNRIVLGIANQGVLVRFVNMPKVPADKVGQVIRYQAQDYLPMAVDSTIMDYAVLGEKTSEDNKVLEVLLVAAKKDMVERFLNTLGKADLKTQDIGVSALNLIRMVPAAGVGQGATALVDIANGLSNVVVVDKGIPRFARQISAGLQDLATTANYELSDVLGVGNNQAVQDWIKSLTAEVRSSLSYYQGQPGAVSISDIVLSGRGARIAGLVQQL
ncbi:MAG: type IV pilus assembly protein PilM, partial [Ignavibacteriales bacterium]